MRKLILVVDSSLVSRKILEICLGREGYEVVSYEDAGGAWRDLERAGGPVPALAILSADLPAMEGFLFACLLRSTPHFRRVVTVMLVQPRSRFFDLVKARLAGARAVVEKPLRTQEVLDVVRGFLG